MCCPMTHRSGLHQPTVALLLSLDAKLTSSGGYELPLDVWLKQRETIASSQIGVGPGRRPSLQVTFSCVFCHKLKARAAFEVAKTVRRGKPVRMTCSAVCRTRMSNTNRGFIDRSCNVCGMELLNSRGRRTCSDACLHIARRRFQRPAAVVPPRHCEICSHPFTPAWGPSKARFCSRKCQAKGHKLAMTGRANPNFRHGLGTDRGDTRAWYAAKKQVWQRDQMMCVVCQSDEQLQVHHVNMIPTDHALFNLISLCRGCHKQAHSRLRPIPSQWLSDYAVHAMFSISRSKELSASSPTISSSTTASSSMTR